MSFASTAQTSTNPQNQPTTTNQQLLQNSNTELSLSALQKLDGNSPPAQQFDIDIATAQILIANLPPHIYGQQFADLCQRVERIAANPKNFADQKNALRAQTTLEDISLLLTNKFLQQQSKDQKNKDTVMFTYARDFALMGISLCGESAKFLAVLQKIFTAYGIPEIVQDYIDSADSCSKNSDEKAAMLFTKAKKHHREFITSGEEKDREYAITCCKQAAALFSKGKRQPVYFYIGSLYAEMLREKFDSAIREAANLYLQLAVSYDTPADKKGKYFVCLGIINSAKWQNTKTMDAYYAAINYFNESIGANNTFAPSFYNLGILQGELGKSLMSTVSDNSNYADTDLIKYNLKQAKRNIRTAKFLFSLEEQPNQAQIKSCDNLLRSYKELLRQNLVNSTDSNHSSSAQKDELAHTAALLSQETQHNIASSSSASSTSSPSLQLQTQSLVQLKDAQYYKGELKILISCLQNYLKDQDDSNMPNMTLAHRAYANINHHCSNEIQCAADLQLGNFYAQQYYQKRLQKSPNNILLTKAIQYLIRAYSNPVATALQKCICAEGLAKTYMQYYIENKKENGFGRGYALHYASIGLTYASAARQTESDANLAQEIQASLYGHLGQIYSLCHFNLLAKVNYAQAIKQSATLQGLAKMRLRWRIKLCQLAEISLITVANSSSSLKSSIITWSSPQRSPAFFSSSESATTTNHPNSVAEFALSAITHLPDELLAEVLSYLPVNANNPILTSVAGLKFFRNHNLVFRIKLRDIYQLDWYQCCRIFGVNNLCLLPVAYKQLHHGFATIEAQNFEQKQFVNRLHHPFVPAGILQQLPTTATELKNVILAWNPESKEDKLGANDYRYGIRLACLSGNLRLVQSLVKHGRANDLQVAPNKDNLYMVIRSQFLPLIKYILDKDNKFGISTCMSCYDLATQTNNPAVVSCLLAALPTAQYAEVVALINDLAKKYQAQKIIAYLQQKQLYQSSTNFAKRL